MLFRKTDFFSDENFKRKTDSRKTFTGRHNEEKFFPIDIVELVLLKIGVIDKFQDLSNIKSKELINIEMSNEYQMREKFLELYDDLFVQVLDEFERMINIRSGGIVISSEKGRRSDDDGIMVKKIVGYDRNNLINVAYRRGMDTEYCVFSNLRVRSDFKKDLDYKDFITEQINLYYVKNEFINQ